MSNHQAYCCNEPQCDRACLKATEKGLVCPNGHLFPYAPGTKVPIFTSEQEGANEYSIKDAANIHDNALRWVFKTFGTDEASLRRNLISRLGLNKGARVLVTGAGTGNDLPYIAESLANHGEIFAQDFAQYMLLAGVERHQSETEKLGIELHFSVSDATNLPFLDCYFDAAYHFGGINLFSDIRKGIAEMNRVVKNNGKVVVSDEGLAPWLMETEYGKMLINNNSLYACDIPLSLLPETARDVRISWELCNSFYVIEFTVSDQPLQIDIDVPHVGKRGGSIRTRYLGQLEGIDPALRDRIYGEAERAGMSRVEYLELLLDAGLKNKKRIAYETVSGR